MRITFAGAYKSARTGTWQCRGAQMAEAIAHLGAKTRVAIRGQSIGKCNALVIVKRPDVDHLAEARDQGAAIVFDPLDWWPQDVGPSWSRDEACSRLWHYVEMVVPDGVVLPTRAMQRDLGWPGPTLVLPHHARPSQRVNPIREHVTRVGYEGAVHYLGPWRQDLGEQCIKRGWQFVENPKSLADLDIVVAFRGGRHRGYVTDNWKSGVKLANAQASGTPFVGLCEAGYTDIESGGENWVDDAGDLVATLDTLADQSERRQCASLLKASAHKVALPALARQYLVWLQEMFGRRREPA